MSARLSRAVCALFVASFVWTAPLQAHPVPFSYLDLRIGDGVIDGWLVAHIEDVAHELGVQPSTRLLDPAFAGGRAPAIVAILSARLDVSADGHHLTPGWPSSVEVLAERQSLRMRVHYRTGGTVGRLSIEGLLFPYDPAHRTFVNVYDGPDLMQAILEVNHQQIDYFSGTKQGTLAVIGTFTRAGVHHILIGPDHLLFLLGLLLLGGSIGRLALMVTGFTIAHSLTLTVAALNVLTPPARLIEPAIALSIVYVGADNLLVSARPASRDLRPWMAFGFGFIHGFGFANVLREMDLPRRALGWSLFSFNLGVEIGQLLVVVPVAAAIALLWARSRTAARRVALGGSVLVVAAGVFWFAQRVFFPGR